MKSNILIISILFITINYQLQTIDEKKSSQELKKTSEKIKKHNNPSATEEEKKSNIQDFLKTVQDIPKQTPSNHKEYKESIDKARASYQKMYKFATKKPFVLTKPEYQEIKKTRKHLDELYAQLKKDNLKNNPTKSQQTAKKTSSNKNFVNKQNITHKNH